MPELPEVHTTTKGINEKVVGMKIVDVWTEYKSAYHKGNDNIKDKGFFEFFKSVVVGAKIIKAERRAKNILIRLSNNHTILVHLKMTGHLLYGQYVFDQKKREWRPSMDERKSLHDPFNRFIRLAFTLSKGARASGQLVLCDMRKFAKVTLFKTNDSHTTSHLKDLGPEPLDSAFTFAVFKAQILKRSNRAIKTVLMDQSLISGIGNIYSDEALWRAGIHPESLPSKIPDAVLKKLYGAIKEVLNSGIDFGGDSMSDYRNIDGERGKFQEKHRAYRRAKSVCEKKGCGGIITRKVIATRSAHFCNKHQKLFE